MSGTPTDPPSTLRELADHLGLAVSTISRTLSGQGDRYRIGKSTQEKITAAASEFGVRPNLQARGLRLKRTLSIGLILPDITNPFFASIARAVERGAAERDYVTMLCDTADEVETEQRAIRFMLERQADALIVCPTSHDPSHFSELVEKGVPLVFVDRFFEELSAPSVTSDDYAAGKQVATLFASKGHRTVGCLAGDLRTSSSRNRLAGFRSGMKEKGVVIEEPFIRGSSYSISDGYESARKLLEMTIRPTGLFSFANVNTLGALQALGEAGLKIPGDISLVSFDDQPYATVLAAPLSSVVQNTTHLAEEALRLTFSQLDSAAALPAENIAIPTQFVDRNSVRLITS